MITQWYNNGGIIYSKCPVSSDMDTEVCIIGIPNEQTMKSLIKLQKFR